jgi:hypothetical protein
MDAKKYLLLSIALAGISFSSLFAAPFRYVWAKAYHVLPQTTSEESGYFSICEGLNGRMYIGTAKYQQNAYLVEFNPQTEQQRIVLDVNQVCGLTATGYAAQAKIHTRNFVGPSGTIYVGSKQGYPVAGDTSSYPGGYLLTYDPDTDRATNLGMAYPTQGLIDTVADEARQLIYMVTCEAQHWMLLNRQTDQLSELSVTGTPYASTLIDARGTANLLSTNFNLAQYNPDTGSLQIRPIYADGQLFARTNSSAIPTWNLHPDRTKAYLILMNDPRLLEIDLLSTGTIVTAHYRGKMLEGLLPDSRCALSVAPDGKVFAVIKVRNTTGFTSASGEHWLHHLTYYNPRDGSINDLGALAVQNADWYPFTSGSPNTESWPAHGFEQLPDAVIVPRYHHMAMMVAKDYSVYVTIIYPFTLLHVPAANLGFTNIVTAASSEHGSISPSGSVSVVQSGATNFQIQCDRYYHIEKVLLNGIDSGLTFDAGCTQATVAWTNILGDGSIFVRIAPNVSIHATPDWWLAAHGLTNKAFNLSALDDDDHDGLDNWQEYQAGTDPTNAFSSFQIIGQGQDHGSNYVLWTGGGCTDLPPFSILRRTNIWQTSWDLAESIPRSPVSLTNIWYDPLSPPAAFYRIEVPQN